MCCRVTIEGRGPRHNDIIHLSGFKPGTSGWPGDQSSSTKIRELGDGTWLTLREDSGKTTINIYPAISEYAHHLPRREAGALMFKVGAFLAEDAQSKLVQEASVGMCLIERNVSSLTIAMYPEMPLTFDNLCRGFREVFLGITGET